MAKKKNESMPSQDDNLNSQNPDNAQGSTTNDGTESNEPGNPEGPSSIAPKRRPSGGGRPRKGKTKSTSAEEIVNDPEVVKLMSQSRKHAVSQTRVLANKVDRIPNKLIKQDGFSTLNRNLTMLMERYSNEQINLPFGSLDRIAKGTSQRIQTYMGMIALRYKAIAEPEWSDVPILVDAGIEISEEELGELKDAYSQATRRYLSSNIIQPLLRNILVEREGVTKFTGVKVIELAYMYSTWMKNADNAMLRAPLMNTITAEISNLEALGSYVALKDTLLTGVSQSCFVGLPLLVSALEEGQGKYGLESTEDGFVSKMPSAILARETSLYGVDKKPLWVTDTIKSNNAPISMSDVAALITMMAKLQSINLIEDLGIEFMSRYPDWSGLLVSEEARLSDLTMNWLNDLCEQEFIRTTTLMPTVDSTIMSIFNEPNRSDLHTGVYERLYFVSLAHKVASNVIADILGCVMTSIEYRDLPIWSDINSLLKREIAPVAFVNSGYSLDRSFSQGNAFSIVKAGFVQSGHYYVESGLKLLHPVLSDLLLRLDEAGAVSRMNSQLISVRPFMTSGTHKFCYTSNENINGISHVHPVQLDVELLEDLADSTGLDVNDMLVTPIRKHLDSKSAEFALIGTTTPVIITRYQLAKKDMMTYSYTDVEMDDFDVTKIYDAKVIHKGFRIFMTADAYYKEEGPKIALNTDAYLILPEVKDAFADLLSVWSHDMTKND